MIGKNILTKTISIPKGVSANIDTITKQLSTVYANAVYVGMFYGDNPITNCTDYFVDYYLVPKVNYQIKTRRKWKQRNRKIWRLE